MAGVNRHILVGHLGRDPEQRAMTNGGKVVTFSLAVSESWKDKNSGERKESTSWHNVVVFNEGLGDIAMRYLRKGSQAYVEGEVLTRSYDANGTKKYVTETVLKPYRGSIVLLDRAEKAPVADPSAYGSPSAPPPVDDDVPF